MVAPDVAHAQSTTDYDSDDDGLIEVANLDQLNAIRYDLNGDGATASGSDTTNYTAAFPNAASGMGCPMSGTPTGCEGYELTADLNFDTDGDGDTDEYEDVADWYNPRYGWLPIGTSSDAFDAKFDGGGHAVTNLYIRRDSGDVGLFGVIGANGEVSNLGLTVSGTLFGSFDGNTGVLAGQNAGTVTASFAAIGTTPYSPVSGRGVTTGGLVGKNSGTISGSYTDITVEIHYSGRRVGGLVGENSGMITDSYAKRGIFTSSEGNTGGLVGRLGSSGSISNSYSVGYVAFEPFSRGTAGGLVGAKSASGTVTASYWDTDISDHATSPGGGIGKTTTELQTPTSNTGIYADWDTTRWDFVDANHFPLLKADWDGDGTATWGEFGDQDPEPEFADDASIDDMVLRVGTYLTRSSLPKIANAIRFPRTSVRVDPALPDGLYYGASHDPFIAGTPTEELARTKFTWNFYDDDDGVASISFYLTVLPSGDYDIDDDGLIEVGSLGQLDAVRWDLDGDGASTNSGYATAFPNADTGMGCNEDEADAADQVCEGYELSADLDFDTNGDGRTDLAGTGCTATSGVYSGTCDVYWNDGTGWAPLGSLAATFDGGGHTISNLFVSGPSAGGGLFSGIASTGVARNLGLVDVNVTGSAGYDVGSLAGSADGAVSFIHVSGGTVVAKGAGAAGGLVGSVGGSGGVTASLTAVAVSSAGSGNVGGLVGELSATASVDASYAAGSASSTSTGNVGGLVGSAAGTADIGDSYAVGAVSGTNSGGLLGSKAATATVTTSYWDTGLSGQSTSSAGTAKTTSNLQTPTSNTGIYAGWDTADWDFVDSNHFPLLNADWDGDGTATWGEFGDQDPEPKFAGGAAIDDLILGRGLSYTSPSAFPEALGGNGEAVYSLATLPTGLSLNSERKLTGTPTALLAKTAITYTAADTDDGKATLSFYLTVIAPVDYDSDDDGLIEVANLAQLNAIRWDLDGDGTSTNSGYTAAFPAPETAMGCNEDETDAADQVCEGYELTADLDFDTNGDGRTNQPGRGCSQTYDVFLGTCDDYWNDGDGWLPIGASSDAFDAKFDGGGHVVSNLWFFRGSRSDDSGLFGAVGADGEVSNLGLLDVDIFGGLNTGALAGQNAGTITATFVDNRKPWSLVWGGSAWDWTQSVYVPGQVGGLVGKNSGTISGSYTFIYVGSSNGQVGGLAGVNSGTITDSYAAFAAFSRGGGNGGGLVGQLDSSGSITNSYSFGNLGGTPASGSTLGGLVGAKSASATVTASYWDTDASGQTTSPGGGTGKTTSELQTPTSNTGIYADWATTRWDFVDANNFPLLKTDWDGDGTATWGEFGDQDPEPEFADDAAIDDMLLTVDTAFTSPALPRVTNSYRFNSLSSKLSPSLPDGLQLTSDDDGHYISGTPTEALAKTQFTWTSADLDDGVDSLTFYLTVESSGNRPVLGVVADKVYVQGEAVDFTLPAATSGDSHPNYVYTLAPDVSGVGLSFDASTRKLTGTPSAPKAKVSFTFTATESSDPDGTVESASRTFTVGVKPKKPASFSATAGDTTVDLAWAAISGVSGWEVKQGSGSWTAIAGSDGTTSSHTVTGLTNDTAYTFEVRAFVGTGDTRVGGVESNVVTVTPVLTVGRPVLAGVADKVFVQGEVVEFTLPAAAGGDGHPNYVYTLTPDPSGVGLAFDASTRTLSGTPSAPAAKVSFTYTATEAADPDGTVESASRTFTIGVRPKKPENFSVTGDGEWAVLAWTAISGVDGWQVKQGSGSWRTIGRSDASTSRTAVHLAGGAAYTFKVRAFVGTGDTRVEGVESEAISGILVVDYDSDDDGLIDISSLVQIRASRLDKNGDGITDDPSMQVLYNRAFPGAADRMGCPSTCRGYELATDDLTPRPQG